MICEREVEFVMKRNLKVLKRVLAIGILAAFVLVGMLSFAATTTTPQSKHTAKKATVMSSAKTGIKVPKLSKTYKTSKIASKKFNLNKKKRATSKSSTSAKSKVKTAASSKVKTTAKSKVKTAGK